jgi:hypothetical protein
LLRLNVHLAVPRAYFSGPFAEDVTWSQFGGAQTPALPRDVRDIAADVLESLGISRQMRPHDALHGLVEYYRNFEGRPFPSELRGEDLYVSLSREQVGVCRHRSLAFLISARALGIPTRYIYNEAHAFVEVFWPKLGWRRIDLGGAADELNYSSQSGSSVHDAGRDSLPQPPNYQAEIERIRERGGEVGEGQGEQSEQAAEEQAAEEQDAHEHDEAAGEHEVGEHEVGEHEVGEHEVGEQGEELAESGRSQSDRSQTEQSAPEMSEAADDNRTRVILDAAADTSEVFRGNSLGLKGSLFTQQGKPLAKKKIQVFLSPVGSKAASTRIDLGTLRTDGGGRFYGELSIPDSVAIGRWTVILEFAGDQEHRSARSK